MIIGTLHKNKHLPVDGFYRLLSIDKERRFVVIHNFNTDFPAIRCHTVPIQFIAFWTCTGMDPTPAINSPYFNANIGSIDIYLRSAFTYYSFHTLPSLKFVKQ